jgi:ATP-dependent helicase/nuclease subunit A
MPMPMPNSPAARAEAEQRRAADPAASAWVSASAGSGKTKVLIDRVLRLLLDPDQAPGRILCLTFTRAAAAQMQARLRERLGEWAIWPEARLTAELARLTGAPPAPARLLRARRLLVDVLDLPGGMRISTIHAFCQSLLRGFPLEAGLPPQFAVLEQADANLLVAEAREAELAAAGGSPELALLAAAVSAEDFGQLTRMLAGDRVRERLAASLAASGQLAGLRQRLAAAVGAPESLDEREVLDTACRFDSAPLLIAARLLQASKNANDQTRGGKLAGWLAQAAAGRAARFEEWLTLFLTGEGQPRAARSLATQGVGARQVEVIEILQAEGARLVVVQEALRACRLAAATTALLTLAAPVLQRVAQRQKSAGLLDYGDLIAYVRRILNDPGCAWVLFKLDGGLDHLLLDEAQDSNPAQWSIAAALTAEFFAGAGATGDRRRTIFAVGDSKQAIYGFQGADAAGFASWRHHYAQAVTAAGGAFCEVPLDVSFRSTAAVLALVDAVFAEGPAREGVVAPGATLQHLAHRQGQAGSVELWPLLQETKAPETQAWQVPEAAARASGGEALLAETLAARIAHMLATETLISRDRPVRAGDIMVLVRRQSTMRFVPLLTRALKARQLPVLAVTAVKLVEHIAVMDLLALCDVLLHPDDDLQLAALLKSPLIGLSETALLALAHGRTGSLWQALQAERAAAAGGRAAAAADWLARLALRADLVTPHALLAAVLGEASLDGTPARARLLARLGPEAADMLDELLNAALAHERRYPPSLQSFVHWLRQGGAEVKREAEAGGDAVRIMTVHNAKGLQAPIVFLVDVGSGKGNEQLRWLTENGVELPLWAPNKAHAAAAFETAKAAEMAVREAEENRLLYVALTRAEDRLIACGWGDKPRDWYGKLAAGFDRLAAARIPLDPTEFGGPAEASFGDGMLRRHATPQTVAPQPETAAPATAATPLPDWASRPAPVEASATVLSPSALPGEAETPAAPPLGPDDPTGSRFRRGRLIHALLQHLPGRPAAAQAAAATAFLARPGHGLSAAEQAAIMAEVLALTTAPPFAAAFGPGSLAEAPIAGRIAGQLVAGQVDRLLIEPDRVLVLDYKTNRPPPEEAAAVPALYLRQMAAYRALLRQAFPGRRIECALVWTHGARLLPLPEAVLDRHAPGGD